MSYRLTEFLDTLDFYGSTLSKTAWYQAPSTMKKKKPAKGNEMPRRNKKRSKHS